MNTENLVSLNLNDTQIANVDAALAVLETELSGLIALNATIKRRMRKMGKKSESFSRQALQVVSQKPEMIPPNVPIREALEDLRQLDQLRPRLARLTLLCQRGEDTDAALGNDIMHVALQAYSLMKLTGAKQGMAPLRRELSDTFTGRRSAKADPAETPKERKTA